MTPPGSPGRRLAVMRSPVPANRANRLFRQLETGLTASRTSLAAARKAQPAHDPPRCRAIERRRTVGRGQRQDEPSPASQSCRVLTGQPRFRQLERPSSASATTDSTGDTRRTDEFRAALTMTRLRRGRRAPHLPCAVQVRVQIEIGTRLSNVVGITVRRHRAGNASRFALQRGQHRRIRQCSGVIARIGLAASPARATAICR